MESETDGVISQTSEELQKFIENEYFIHYVCMATRPGISECITMLEHTHYPPDTFRNDLFNIRIIKWSNLLWILVSIPVEEKEYMETIVKQTGLRIIRGTPIELAGESPDFFPAEGENVFTLINQPNHPSCQNNPAINAAVRESECETIESILEYLQSQKDK